MSVEYEMTGLRQTGVVSATKWAPRPPVQVWLTGRTFKGRSVRIVGDPYVDERSEVYVDGQRVDVSGVRRLRDGGTTTIVTSRGTIYHPSPFRSGRTTLDGEPLS